MIGVRKQKVSPRRLTTMDWHEKQALSNCRVFIIENVHDVVDLLDDFLQAGLVNTDNAEEITVQTTKLRRKQAFMDQILTWGPHTFTVLLKSLERTGHPHVVEKLMDELNFVRHTKQKTHHRETTPTWLTNQVGSMCISEKALHLLAQELPPTSFTGIGTFLGLTNGRLQHFLVMHNNSPSLQYSTMLCEWKAVTSLQAKVETLVGAFRLAKVDEEVYRDIILDDLGILEGQNMELIHRMDSICTSPSGRSGQWV